MGKEKLKLDCELDKPRLDGTDVGMEIIVGSDLSVDIERFSDGVDFTVDSDNTVDIDFAVEAVEI